MKTEDVIAKFFEHIDWMKPDWLLHPENSDIAMFVGACVTERSSQIEILSAFVSRSDIGYLVYHFDSGINYFNFYDFNTRTFCDHWKGNYIKRRKYSHELILNARTGEIVVMTSPVIHEFLSKLRQVGAVDIALRAEKLFLNLENL